VRDALEAHERGHEGNDRLAFLDGGRRPEIEDSRLAVQVPLAGAIDLGQQVEGVEPLAVAVSVVVVRLGQRDGALVGIDGGDLLALVGPVPEPIAVQPHVLFCGPAARPVAVVAEEPFRAPLGPAHVAGRGAEDLDDLDEALVGPAGDGHGLVLEEQLDAARPRLAVVGDALPFQVGLEHLAPGGRVEALKHGGVGDRAQSGHALAADHARRRAGLALVHDGRLVGARILRAQLEGLSPLVHARRDRDRDPALGQCAGLLALADLFAGALERGQGAVGLGRVRLGQRARPGVVAGRRDVKRQRARLRSPARAEGRGQGQQGDRQRPALAGVHGHARIHESPPRDWVRWEAVTRRARGRAGAARPTGLPPRRSPRPP